jgi:hypothetical protein
MSLAVLNAADNEQLLARFNDADLIAKGALHVLCFDAIRERSGARWATRQDSVREFIERHFEKYFLPADHLVQMDDVNFLLVQPLGTNYTAQGRALKLLGEVLQFFLGASARADIRLSCVVRIGPDGVEAAQVEVSDTDLARMASVTWASESAEAAATAPAGGPPTAPAAGLLAGAGLVDRQGPAPPPVKGDRTYEAMFVIEPIWSIKQRAVVSYLLRPLIFEHQADRIVEADLANATLGDLVRLDLIVLAEAKRIFDEQGSGHHFALHVPIHHASLGMISTRQVLLSALDRLKPLAPRLVMVLTGLDTGAPQSRILELTSVLSNKCRAVVALAPDLDCKIDRWRDAHLSGVAVDLNLLISDEEPSDPKRMSEFADRLKGVAPALFAYSTPNTAVMLAAWSAGFTHVGGDIILRGQAGELLPLRVNPIDIYRDSA